ncbi:Vanillyl-alcohol oxidase protein [Rutstroemia sp. NJR-2017a BVV2]|nr:Vanillyl-alcohol oxidase protein [Rutstroemia sp. NJR-2017a BVV2]
MTEPGSSSKHGEPRLHDFEHESERRNPSKVYHAAKENLRFYWYWLLKKANDRPGHAKYRLLNATLVPLILSLADQQLVTSFAILIAALKEWDTITAYHIIVYLAWFSSFTHTVALVSLSDYFQLNRSLAILRGSALDTTGSPDQIERRSLQQVYRCSMYFEPAETGRVFGVFQLVIVGFWVIPIVCVVMGLAFGIAVAVQPRNLDNYPGLMFADDFVSVQDAWTFGQLVTCILLVLPIMAAIEGFWTHLGPEITTHSNGSLSQVFEWSHDLGSDHRKSSGSEASEPQELSLTELSHVPEPYTTKLPTHSANTQEEPVALPVVEGKFNQNDCDTPTTDAA